MDSARPAAGSPQCSNRDRNTAPVSRSSSRHKGQRNRSTAIPVLWSCCNHDRRGPSSTIHRLPLGNASWDENGRPHLLFRIHNIRIDMRTAPRGRDGILSISRQMASSLCCGGRRSPTREYRLCERASSQEALCRG